MTERMRRINESVRQVLSEAVGQLKDPRIGFVTVTGVRVSHDLQVAWVYFTALGDASAKAGSRAALRSATPHLRRELGRQIRLKVVPELRFEEDETLATGERIDRIIDQLHHEEGASHDA